MLYTYYMVISHILAAHSCVAVSTDDLMLMHALSMNETHLKDDPQRPCDVAEELQERPFDPCRPTRRI
jgi:hypothetical protein